MCPGIWNLPITPHAPSRTKALNGDGVGCVRTYVVEGMVVVGRRMGGGAGMQGRWCDGWDWQNCQGRPWGDPYIDIHICISIYGYLYRIIHIWIHMHGSLAMDTRAWISMHGYPSKNIHLWIAIHVYVSLYKLFYKDIHTWYTYMDTHPCTDPPKGAIQATWSGDSISWICHLSWPKLTLNYL